MQLKNFTDIFAISYENYKYLLGLNESHNIYRFNVFILFAFTGTSRGNYQFKFQALFFYEIYECKLRRINYLRQKNHCLKTVHVS